MTMKNSPIEQAILHGRFSKDGDVLKVADHFKEWKERAFKIFDRQLEEIKDLIIKILRSSSPVLDLEKDKRAFAALYNAKPDYSPEIRAGVVETLVYIGVYPDLLCNCSKEKRENAASNILECIFQDMSWKTWADLNDFLPLFAEAAPETYLTIVQKLLENQDVIQELQDENGGNIFEQQYWIGIVSSLQTLAWSQDYFARVVNILTSFAIVDRGGNTNPRPQSALNDFFVYWYPKTLVSHDVLVGQAKLLINKYPELGWEIISSALTTQFSGHGGYLPKFRNFVPEGFDPQPLDDDIARKLRDRYEQVLLEASKSNIFLLKKLSGFLGDIKILENILDALDILASPFAVGLSDEDKVEVWENINVLLNHNKRFPNAKWVLPPEVLVKLESIIPVLKPLSPIYQYKHLFGYNTFDWQPSNDYKSAEEILDQERVQALNEIFNQYGMIGIEDFSAQIKNSYWVGRILGDIGDYELDKKIFPKYLNDHSPHVIELIQGYASRRYEIHKNTWLEQFDFISWKDEMKATFIKLLPSNDDVWIFMTNCLKGHEKLYWKNVQNVASGDREKQEFALKKLLEHENYSLAFRSLFDIYWKEKTVNYDLCVDVLTKIVNKIFPPYFDNWKTVQLINCLQKMAKTEEEQEKLQRIEFIYLALLDSTTEEKRPILLEKTLAKDPEIFHQFLCIIYKSENPEIAKAEENEKRDQNIWYNSYMLIKNWKTLPGFSTEGVFNFSEFQKWYDDVKLLCSASGRLKHALQTIGAVLIYAPQDSSGLWIEKNIAELLNKKENSILRESFYSAVIYSRGVHTVDTTGNTEMELAKTYKQKAEALEMEGFFNFSKTLRDIANAYIQEALRNQEDYVYKTEK